MSVMAATISVSTLGHTPMAPSAAAMAAAQAIMAAQALQAHAAEMQADAKAVAQAPDQLGSTRIHTFEQRRKWGRKGCYTHSS